MKSATNFLSESLKELEENFTAYSERLLTVRMDDFKRAVIGEVNQALTDHGNELLSSAPARMEGFAFCMTRDQCRHHVESVIADSLMAFQKTGPEAAMEILGELRDKLTDSSTACTSKECSEYLLKVLTEAESAFSMASRIQSRMSRIATPPAEADILTDPYTMQAMAALSNPHRVSLMNFMRSGEKAFSEMTDHSGLKAGHLQFHLRNLMELGLMDKTNRRGTYTITAEGLAALDAMQEFGNRISTVRGGE